MIPYKLDNKDGIRELFSLIRYPIPDYILRLDLIGVLACSETTDVDTILRQMWMKMFPMIARSREIEQKCETYYTDYRFGFKLIGKGETIQKTTLLFKTLVPITVLSVIAQATTTTIKLDQLKKDVLALVESTLNDRSFITDRVTEILQQYFEDQTILSGETILLIRQYRDIIEHVSENLRNSLMAQKNERQIQKPVKESTQNSISESVRRANPQITPLRYARIVCLFYLALVKKNKNNESREYLLREQWPAVFGSIPYDQQAENTLNQMIESDSDLQALDMLFRYPLKDIRSGRIIRRIVVSLCVHQVLSKISHGSSADLVIDEATTLFSRFSALSVGKEEEDIERTLKKYVTSDEIIDDRVTGFLRKYSDTVSELFKLTLENINSAESARKRFWWEELLNKKDQEVGLLHDQLQNQLEAIQADTIYKLVDKLTCSSYNYLLSRLYRFAYGYDLLSKDELQILTKNLIQLLQLFGVKAFGTEWIDIPLSDKRCDQARIATADILNMNPNCVAFPGWSVSGDMVILPMAAKETEEKI